MSIVNMDDSMPEGLGFRLAMDMKAMTSFVNMPEQKKQDMINYIKSSSTGDEARNRVNEAISSLHGNNTGYFR